MYVSNTPSFKFNSKILLTSGWREVPSWGEQLKDEERAGVLLHNNALTPFLKSGVQMCGKWGTNVWVKWRKYWEIKFRSKKLPRWHGCPQEQDKQKK